jgi:hypothetical protein
VSSSMAYLRPPACAKRQTVVSRSNAEAEYRVIANNVPEATYLRQLLHELQSSPSRCTLIYCDNISVVYLSTNPVQHQRIKHLKIDLHFVRENMIIGQVCILHVSTTSSRRAFPPRCLLILDPVSTSAVAEL